MSAPPSPPPGTMLSPLEQVQRVEHESAQQQQAARLRAEEQIKAAQQQAARAKHNALEAVRRQRTREHQDVIVDAHQAARDLLEQARQQADALTHQSDMRLEEMVSQALALVIGATPEDEA